MCRNLNVFSAYTDGHNRRFLSLMAKIGWCLLFYFSFLRRCVPPGVLSVANGAFTVRIATSPSFGDRSSHFDPRGRIETRERVDWSSDSSISIIRSIRTSPSPLSSSIFSPVSSSLQKKKKKASLEVRFRTTSSQKLPLTSTYLPNRANRDTFQSLDLDLIAPAEQARDASLFSS